MLEFSGANIALAVGNVHGVVLMLVLVLVPGGAGAAGAVVWHHGRQLRVGLRKGR